MQAGPEAEELGARAPPLWEPKRLKSALFYPEFPMDKVPQAPPHFSTHSSTSGQGRSQIWPEQGVWRVQKPCEYFSDCHFVRILVKMTKHF